MKKFLLFLGFALAITLTIPSFIIQSAAQEPVNTAPSYSGMGRFYSDRFFPISMTNPANETAAENATQAEENTTNNANNTNEATESNNNVSMPVTYDAGAGTITFEDPNGDTITLNIADMGLDADWMSALLQNGGTLSATFYDDDSLRLLVGSDECGAKKWEYDPENHLVSHYEGDAGNEICTVVTCDVEHFNYIWASNDAADPGAGPDGHVVAQRFNYDEQKNLTSVDYFAWTGGNRGGLHPELHKKVFGELLTKARYMYRQDTVVGVIEECGNPIIDTKYYNDPFPVDWDPVLTGTVVKDEYGNYWLDTGCKMYLLTCQTDGFDADKDGKSGADEMNGIDLEGLVGQEITVRGHQIASDSEAGIYYQNQQAEMFSVVDVITPEEKAQMEDEGTYETTMQNMEDVAAGVDPVHDGLIGDENGPGELGIVNLFNGTLPTTEQLVGNVHLERLMDGLAPIYLDNIENLQEIRMFAIPALDTALTAAEEARQQNNNAEQNNDNLNAAANFQANNNAEDTNQNVIDTNAAVDDEALAGPEALKNRADNWLDEVHDLDPF